MIQLSEYSTANTVKRQCDEIFVRLGSSAEARESIANTLFDGLSDAMQNAGLSKPPKLDDMTVRIVNLQGGWRRVAECWEASSTDENRTRFASEFHRLILVKERGGYEKELEPALVGTHAATIAWRLDWPTAKSSPCAQQIFVAGLGSLKVLKPSLLTALTDVIDAIPCGIVLPGGESTVLALGNSFDFTSYEGAEFPFPEAYLRWLATAGSNEVRSLCLAWLLFRETSALMAPPTADQSQSFCVSPPLEEVGDAG